MQFRAFVFLAASIAAVKASPILGGKPPVSGSGAFPTSVQVPTTALLPVPTLLPPGPKPPIAVESTTALPPGPTLLPPGPKPPVSAPGTILPPPFPVEPTTALPPGVPTLIPPGPKPPVSAPGVSLPPPIPVQPTTALPPVPTVVPGPKPPVPAPGTIIPTPVPVEPATALPPVQTVVVPGPKPPVSVPGTVEPITALPRGLYAVYQLVLGHSSRRFRSLNSTTWKVVRFKCPKNAQLTDAFLSQRNVYPTGFWRLASGLWLLLVWDQWSSFASISVPDVALAFEYATRSLADGGPETCSFLPAEARLRLTWKLPAGH
ncbi:hypothetical protein AURDEDRAFT_124725 [Auricularia subglabra TFB-10046 SS5]|nr:hypothetical protein AURDEDRAFT_124725 [Auricularia subglabra TFB-10046 SS5]